MDCRNLIHWPRARRSSLEAAAPMSLALAAHVLFPVSPRTILGFGYPCCAPGAACCPAGSAASDRPVSGGGSKREQQQALCCSQRRVTQWLGAANRSTWSGSQTHALSPALYRREPPALRFFDEDDAHGT